MNTKKFKKDESSNCCAEFIKMFDFYKDLPDSLSEPTLTGASVSIVLIGIISLLVFQATYNII